MSHKAAPVYKAQPNGWRGPRMHTRDEERTYGAALFFLLHERTPREHAKGNALLNLTPGMLVGRGLDTGLIPEATRVYLALCKRFSRAPEAVAACVFCYAETERRAYVAHSVTCTCDIQCRKVSVCERCGK